MVSFVESQIGTSCDTSFEEMIQEHTNNTGVHYILNSLSGEKLAATLRCIRKKGKFIEIGKYDVSKNSSVGLGLFLREVSFFCISLERLLRSESNEKLRVC